MFHPISLVLPKETGWSPKEKRLWGGGAPVRFRGPPASPTRVGGATRPLRCPLRGRIESLAPGARGLGWRKSSQVKVFCPAFLQKSGRGPGAEPMAARRSARNAPCARKAQEGVKGEPSPGVPPLRAASAARSPCPHRQMKLLYGNPPRSFEQGQRNGADLQRKVKPISDKTASACGFNRLSHLRTGRDRRATG